MSIDGVVVGCGLVSKPQNIDKLKIWQERKKRKFLKLKKGTQAFASGLLHDTKYIPTVCINFNAENLPLNLSK